MENAILTILSKMQHTLTPTQIKQLGNVLRATLCRSEALTNPNEDLLGLFIAAKQVEGCSQKTLDLPEHACDDDRCALQALYASNQR